VFALQKITAFQRLIFTAFCYVEAKLPVLTLVSSQYPQKISVLE